jgi:hypothetical protein
VSRLSPVLTDACFTPGAPNTQLQVWGYSTPRQLNGASVSIGVQGSSISRTIPLDAVASDYFLNAQSIRTGGSFALQFQVPVPSSAGSSVSITLTNQIGSSEARQARRCQ